MIRDVLTLTDAQILAIPEDRPDRLFSGNERDAKNELRRLRSKWYPDHAGALMDLYAKVSAHINVLYDKAMSMMDDGTWQGPGELLIEAAGDRKYSFRYLKSETFELGRTYIGSKFLAYYITNDYADIVRVAQDHIEHFQFFDAKLKEEHEKSLPKLTSVVATQNGDGYYFILNKDPSYIRLSDVLDHFDGKLSDRHAAWIISRLYNLSCYLKISGLVHADISPRNLFICPEHHYVALYGGWWYARREDERLIALPPRTVQYGPKLRTDKKATSLINSELIKATGRECLGDIVGSKLISMKYPAPLLAWLRTPAQERHAFDEYRTWQNEVLKNSYGARKFVELRLEPKDIYTR